MVGQLPYIRSNEPHANSRGDHFRGAWLRVSDGSAAMVSCFETSHIVVRGVWRAVRGGCAMVGQLLRA